MTELLPHQLCVNQGVGANCNLHAVRKMSDLSFGSLEIDRQHGGVGTELKRCCHWNFIGSCPVDQKPAPSLLWREESRNGTARTQRSVERTVRKDDRATLDQIRGADRQGDVE